MRVTNHLPVVALLVPLTTGAFSACVAAPAARETFSADTPRTTVRGNKFIAPAGWTIEVRGQATTLAPPEGGSHIALVDVEAKDAEAAVAAAWAAYRPEAKWPLKVTHDFPDRDGWSNIRQYDYQTSPNEKRGVGASARRAGDTWTVVIYDMENAVGDKRGDRSPSSSAACCRRGTSASRSPAGRRTSSTRRPWASCRASWRRVARSSACRGSRWESCRTARSSSPTASGCGGLGSPEKPDGDTLFMVASNTKALTTLLLAKLLDEGKLNWETPVTKLLPSFQLGDPDTTRRVLVKHLICACTGLPRQDFEWLFEYGGLTCEGAMKTLAGMKPTSEFGALFQYSNPLAAAAGFVGGHVAYPSMELGAAYDEAMRTRVFEPLGMAATTLDFTRAQAGNHASAARAGRGREAGARDHGRQLRGDPRPSGRRRLEQRAGHAQVRPAGARRG